MTCGNVNQILRDVALTLELDGMLFELADKVAFPIYGKNGGIEMRYVAYLFDGSKVLPFDVPAEYQESRRDIAFALMDAYRAFPKKARPHEFNGESLGLPEHYTEDYVEPDYSQAGIKRG